MRKEVVIIICLSFLIVAMLVGCKHTMSIEYTPTGMTGESNRSGIEGTKTIDKDGNVTMTFSSKKGAGTLDNIITILSLGLIKR